jgi:hypothetical protein
LPLGERAGSAKGEKIYVARPSSSSDLEGHSAAVVAEERKGSAEEGRAEAEAKKLVASPYLAQLIKDQQQRWRH